MSEGVVDSTVEEVKAHPWIFIGGFVALAGLLWYLSGPKATAPQAFTFSYGPSDAQVKAGTALAIAQAGNQTAISAQQIQSTTQEHVYDDYFSYLTTAGNNATTQASTAASYAFQTAQAADNTAVTINRDNNATNLQANLFDTDAQKYEADLLYYGKAHTDELNYLTSVNIQDAQKYEADLAYYGKAHTDELNYNLQMSALQTTGAAA